MNKPKAGKNNQLKQDAIRHAQSLPDQGSTPPQTSENGVDPQLPVLAWILKHSNCRKQSYVL